jgi:hypothetical protein
MARTVKVKNLKELQGAFVLAGRDAPRFAALALREEADEAFLISQSVVPVRFGALLTSGEVHGPFVRGTKVYADITYGGPAAPYALIVHEVGPTSGGRGGKGYKHDYPTRWKYLENPVRLYARDMGSRMTVRVLDMIAKRFDIS